MGSDNNPPTVHILPQQPARRIVKASTPKTSSSTATASPPAPPVDPKNAQDAAEERNRIPHRLLDTPSVQRELELEKLALIKRERLQSAQDRQRTKREQALQERRHCRTQPPAPPTSYNPMSRFLSVFSIAAHPEHKRHYMDEDQEGPLGKKIRSSDSQDDLVLDEVNADERVPNDSWSWYTHPTTLTVAVAASAVVVAWALRWVRARGGGG